ncbi:MAG: hypothetical protein ACP5P9_11500 [Acidimicrobiales bacterium]
MTAFASLSHPARSPAATGLPQDPQMSSLRKTSVLTPGASATTPLA